MLISNSISVNNVTPTLIVDGPVLGECVAHIQCFGDDVVIGDASVSPANGFLLSRSNTNQDRNFTVRLQSEQLYAVSLTGPATVGVLAYTA